MKTRFKYISLLFLCITIINCSKEEITETNYPDDNTINFNIRIDDEKIINTKSYDFRLNTINNLHVLVFDQNGFFLSRTQATPGSNPGNYTIQLTNTDPGLPEEKRKRIIHFICNYDWSDFSDVKNQGKHESELIAPLSAARGVVAYWQRIELENGVSESEFPNEVSLLRNVSKISVINNSGQSIENKELTDISFGIYNYTDHGTVAPFNTITFTFDETSVVESPFASTQTTDENNFLNAGLDDLLAESFICYERKNSTASNPLYVIIKGKYNNDATYTYYKIDIIPEGEEQLYDIQRNYHYILKITEVSGEGVSTLQEAINGPASNNLLYSVVLEDYTSISDGRSALNIETTEIIFAQASKAFSISYSYIPDIATGTENNSYVTFTLEQDLAKPVVDVNSIQIDRTSKKATYSARTVNTVPEYDIHNARLILTAKNNGITLRRVVKLRFRKPFTFSGVSVSPQKIPAVINKPVDINFTIPDNIPESMLPVEIFIRTKTLSPNLNLSFDNKLTLDYGVPGIYRYRYIATKPGKHTIHFLTTSTVTKETLIIESDLFNSTSVNLAN